MVKEVVQNILFTLLNKEYVLKNELLRDASQLIQITFSFLENNCWRSLFVIYLHQYSKAEHNCGGHSKLSCLVPVLCRFLLSYLRNPGISQYGHELYVAHELICLRKNTDIVSLSVQCGIKDSYFKGTSEVFYCVMLDLITLPARYMYPIL